MIDYSRIFLNKLHKHLLLIFFTLCFVSNAWSQSAVPTFHSLGLYWSPSNGSTANECQVDFRALGESTWREGHPLWFDPRDGEYRGSVVNLIPGTTYEVRLNNGSQERTITATTWSEDFPIAQTINIGNISGSYTISQSGTENGYILYTGGSIDGGTYNIEISANVHHVIIRDLTLTNAGRNSIRMYNNVNNVIIDNCEFTGWGGARSGGWGATHGAVHSGADAQGVERIVVQNSEFYNPRYSSNTWDNGGHPDGPQAIELRDSEGNHVFRYNRVYTTNGFVYNDGFGSGTNKSNRGFPNKDSDIYGNHIANVADDAIESEGANENVRIFDNVLGPSYVKIGIASTSVGPLYIFRNIGLHDPYGDRSSNPGAFIKAGDSQGRDGNWYGDAQTYVYHNTTFVPIGQGLGAGGGNVTGTLCINNVFLHHRGGTTHNFREETDNNRVRDMRNGRTNAIASQYVGGTQIDGFGSFDADTVFIDGVDQGEYIPNFSDGFKGTAPDFGACELGGLDNGGGNTSPQISVIADQFIDVDEVLGPLAFTVNDNETASSALTVTAVSTNQSVVQDSDIVLGGSDSDRNITVTPLSGVSGVTQITITVSDGQRTSSESFVLAVGDSAPTITDILDQTTNTGVALGPLAFVVGDNETPADQLTVTATSSNQTLIPDGNIAFGGSGADRTITITPVAGQTGTSTITVTVSDGSNQTSDMFVVTVSDPTNNPPQIQGISDQTIDEDQVMGPLTFRVRDSETPANNLTVTATSSNQGLVTDANIVLGGSGSDRTITITPNAGIYGETTITVTVSDGTDQASTSFLLTVNRVGPVNEPPTISSIADQTMEENTSLGPLAFTVTDTETPGSLLEVTASSDNTSLLPNGNIVLGGSLRDRNITITPTPGQTGVVNVTVSVSDGQDSSSETFQVTVTEASSSVLAVSIVKTDVSCFGGDDGSARSIAAGGTAPYTYSWSNGASSADINQIEAGTYTITVTDNDGTTASATTTIIEPRRLRLSAFLTNADCNGNNGSIDISVTGGTGTVSFSWSNGSNVADQTGLVPGSYTVTATDQNGCTAQATYTIDRETSLSVAETITDASCVAADGAISLAITGGQAPYSYSWSNGATTRDVSNLSPGNYQVEIIDNLGCRFNGSYTVGGGSANFTFTAAISNSDCQQNTGSLSITVAGGVAPYQYDWDNGMTGSDIANLAPGEYTLTVTDDIGCTTTTKFVVDGNPGPTTFDVDAQITNSNCGLADGGISLSLPGGNAGYTFNWDHGASGANLSGLEAGNYGVQIVSPYGCYMNTSFLVNNDAGPAKPSLQIIDGNLVTDDGYSEYRWYLDGDLVSTTSTNSYAPTSAGTYQVVVFSGEGCEATSDALQVDDIPGTSSDSNLNYVEIYPVPADNFINVDIGMRMGAKNLGIAIFTLRGKPVLRMREMNTATQKSFKLNIARLRPGVYLCKIKADKEVVVRRIIII